MSEPSHDISYWKLFAGAVGAFVSLRFIQGTKTEKGIMACGGSALSYFGTTPASDYLHIGNSEGLIGFLIGLFGMAIVSKFYEVIQAVDGPLIAKRLFDKFFPPSH